MAKLGRIAGKFLTGVASVAVPAALANQAAKIQSARDERLQGYNKADRASTQQFTSDQAAEQRAFTGGQGDLNREAQAAQTTATLAATKENQAARIASAEKEGEAGRGSARDLQDASLESSEGIASANRMQNMQIFKASQAERDARLALLESQLKGSELSNRMANVTVGRSESLQKTIDVINNSDAPPELRAAAMESYLLQNPDARKKVIVKQKKDRRGWIDEFAVFDESTGDRQDNIGAGGQPRDALEPKDGREVHEMFKAGKMPGNVAEAWLEYMAR